MEVFVSSVQEWVALSEIECDVWKVQVATHPSGHFDTIDPVSRKKRPGKETQLELDMVNYFSLGIESRIGIGFDRNRTDSALLNRAAYVLEGLKKLLFHRSLYVNEWISHIDVPCVSLVMLNIPSFAGGLDIWKSSAGKSGLDRPLPGWEDWVNPPSLPSAGSECQPIPEIKSGSTDRSPDGPTRAANTPHSGTGAELVSSVPVSSVPVSGVPVSSVPVSGVSASDVRISDAYIVRKFSDKIWNALMEGAVGQSVNQAVGEQRVSDARLEVVAFRSLLELSLANLQHIAPNISSGMRVTQSAKHVLISFKKRRRGRRTPRVYFQVDGEFYIGHRIKEYPSPTPSFTMPPPSPSSSPHLPLQDPNKPRKTSQSLNKYGSCRHEIMRQRFTSKLSAKQYPRQGWSAFSLLCL
ncbi:putative diacylglycerol kinase [Gregarina niphandrodes]|uniref:Diacylglycerol kinase n=1 Tax=Gregarina niphandrodes TaxID=110365 RepID=A0A023B4R8_GRENI|nr:putative diacylglycerol kinase [Gregarina niphandrodes]EZG57257.1 putative diacylglycerol kinase [Gregarina niphandrodes]|eukprot:XP_011131064.1 putative diacylglycerol kinase [Gregarina niphandrodes]